MKIFNLAGARPDIIKVTPIIEALNQHPDKIENLLVHIRQHSDDKMSKEFFEDLGILKPNISPGVVSSSHAEQTAKIIVAFEHVFERASGSCEFQTTSGTLLFGPFSPILR